MTSMDQAFIGYCSEAVMLLRRIRRASILEGESGHGKEMDISSGSYDPLNDAKIFTHQICAPLIGIFRDQDDSSQIEVINEVLQRYSARYQEYEPFSRQKQYPSKVGQRAHDHALHILQGSHPLYKPANEILYPVHHKGEFLSDETLLLRATTGIYAPLSADYFEVAFMRECLLERGYSEVFSLEPVTVNENGRTVIVPLKSDGNSTLEHHSPLIIYIDFLSGSVSRTAVAIYDYLSTKHGIKEIFTI